MITLVSFYCDLGSDTYYSQAANHLRQQCELLRVPHHIESRSFGTAWIDNVRAKPVFLLETLEKLNQDFLWSDVDNALMAAPVEADSMASTVDWGFVRRKSLCVYDCVHLVGNTCRAREFLTRWIGACDAHSGGSHRALATILPEELAAGLNAAYLPISYVRGPVLKLGLSNTRHKKQYHDD